MLGDHIRVTSHCYVGEGTGDDAVVTRYTRQVRGCVPLEEAVVDRPVRHEFGAISTSFVSVIANRSAASKFPQPAEVIIEAVCVVDHDTGRCRHTVQCARNIGERVTTVDVDTLNITNHIAIASRRANDRSERGAVPAIARLVRSGQPTLNSC